MNRNVKIFALLFFFVVNLNAQGIKIRDLPALTSIPASGDILPIATLSPATTKKVDLHTLASYFATDSLLVPSTRTITCTAPLLCAGSTSMDLSANRTLSISPSIMTSTVNGGPVTWSTTGSTITGASNQGIRKALFTLFSTNTTDEDNALITINTIQRTHVSGLARTGIDIRSFTEGDIGGDTSGILDVSTGGGTAASFYLYPNLRPTGFTDYSTASLQPAVEIGTSTSRPALGVITGVAGTGTYHGIGIRVRLDNTVSDGIYVEPANNTYDSTRIAYLVGNWQQNAAPVNVTYKVLMNGNVITSGSGAFTGALSASNLSGTHSGTSSGTNTGDQVVPVNTTATASNWFSAYNSSTGAYTKSRPAMTDLSDATTWEGWTDAGTTINTTTSTDKVGIGTSSPGALLTVSSNTATLPTPTTGAIAQFSAPDSTATRLEVDAYGSGPVFEGRQAQGTAASPTATQSTNTLFNLTGFGYGATGFSSGGRAFIQAQANENWTDSAQGTKLVFGTTINGTTSALTQFTIQDGGHLISGGTAPTVACTGTGTSPSAPTIDTNGTDTKFTVTINTGTGSPGSTGTCTVTFAKTYGAVSPIVCMLVKGATAWGNTSQIQETTESASAPVFTWTNSAGGVVAGLTISTSYKFSCVTFG